jgi:hypothetical protein
LCAKNQEYTKLRYKPQHKVLASYLDMLLSPIIPSYEEVITYINTLDAFDSTYFDEKKTDDQLLKMFTNDEVTSVLIDKIDVPGNIIHYVCEHNENVELFSKLLSKCSNSDLERISSRYGKSPLNLVCQRNKLIFCSLLLSRDITRKSDYRVPLNYAINNLNIEMVEMLLKYDTNVDNYYDLLVFHDENISETAMDILKMLIKYNANVSDLMIYAKDLRVVKLLFDTQINISIRHQMTLHQQLSHNKNKPMSKDDYLNCCLKAIFNYASYMN